MNELQLLETVSLPYEAENLKQLLGAAGIEAYIEGVNSSNTFGMNALMGSVKLKVRAEDLPEARRVLSETFNRAGRHTESWYCGQCQDTNEANFDICWQCGGLRAEVEAERPMAPELVVPPVRPEDLLSPAIVSREYEASPYAPPATEPALPVEPSAAESSPVQVHYEETIERAYRASILGLVTIPVLLHFYSLGLLLSALSLRAETSARISMRFTMAMAIDLVVFLFVGLMLYLMFRGA